MRRAVAIAALLLCLLPVCAHGEELASGIAEALDKLELDQLGEELAAMGEPFASGNLRETLTKIARGEWTLSLDALLQLLSQRFLSALSGSLWRISRLLVPALALGVCNTLGKENRSGQVAAYLCFLLVAIFMVQDLTDHARQAAAAVEKMSGGMQRLFPLLLTLLAAVGGSTGAALFQPAVVAAAGSMTALISKVTLPLAIGSALVTMVDHLGEEGRFNRLAALLHTAATWTLGVCFTVFIGVILTQGMHAAAVDGVTIRTAKYALDNFVPVVGGLFADTVDTLVGGSLLIQNALGTTGLLLILGLSLTPLTQTLAAVTLYKMTSALLQPVAEGRVLRCMDGFSRVLMLFFIIQLCAAAMFILLIAQILATTNLTVMLR